MTQAALTPQLVLLHVVVGVLTGVLIVVVAAFFCALNDLLIILAAVDDHHHVESAAITMSHGNENSAANIQTKWLVELPPCLRVEDDPTVNIVPVERNSGDASCFSVVPVCSMPALSATAIGIF